MHLFWINCVPREILANGEHLMTQKYTDGSGRILTQGPAVNTFRRA